MRIPLAGVPRIAGAGLALAAVALVLPGVTPAAESKWDVTHPGVPREDVTFDTDEGTWISVDVAPSGKLLAFDLLGDIYTLPIEGGDATLISGGIPYEVQPRFSPDGTRILFTSDRGGADNLWVMSVDGSDRRQVMRGRWSNCNRSGSRSRRDRTWKG